MAYDKIVDSAALDNGLTQIADAIRAKGGTSAALAFPNGMANAISAITTGESGGIDTSDATAAASDLAEGKTAYVDGEKITGTLAEEPYLRKTGITPQYTDTGDISLAYLNTGEGNPDRKIYTYGAILQSPAAEFGDATAADVTSGKTFTSAAGLKVTGTKEDAGTPAPTLQTKNVSPSETAQTVVPDEGYDGLSHVVVGAISSTYVASGVARQAAQTITPGTTDQTIASGQYLTGTQTIKGDANLVAGNIKEGVTIFNVAGSYEGSGSSGGLDTSDATATAVDIADGKTAYVNGQKITGTVATYDAYVGWSNIEPTQSGTKVSLGVNTSTPYLFRNGYYLASPLSNFGTATAADVAKGKTFTSASGLNVTGTKEDSGSSGGSGGLPSGVSALASGTVTPADNVSYIDVQHGLGVAPNFLVWFIENDVGTTGIASTATDGAVLTKRVRMNTTAATIYNVHWFANGYNASTSYGQTQNKYSNTTDMTATIARMRTASPYSFKAGYTYRWVCGVAAGIG